MTDPCSRAAWWCVMFALVCIFLGALAGMLV